jgi:hypothetical protein
MSTELMFAVLGIIATTITTTVVVYSKIVALEVAIARLQVQVSHYDERIAKLEKV